MSRVMAEGAKICRCEDCGRVTKCRLEFYDGSPPEFAWVCGPCIRREVRYGADATLRSLQAATLRAAANECRYQRAYASCGSANPNPRPPVSNGEYAYELWGRASALAGSCCVPFRPALAASARKQNPGDPRARGNPFTPALPVLPFLGAGQYLAYGSKFHCCKAKGKTGRTCMT